MARTPTPAPRRPEHIEDDEDAVELSRDLQAAIDEEEAAKAALADDDDDDDDDFDLLGDDDDDDDDDSADDDDGEDDADGGDDDDGDEDEPSLTRVPKVARKGKEPQKSKAQLRIEELAAKRRDAEAEAFKAEMALIEERKAREALEARIAALESGEATTQAKAPTKPDPDKFKYGEVDSDYIDAMVEYRLATERHKFQQEQADKAKEDENNRLAEHYKARLAKIDAEGKKKFKDFDEIVNKTQFPPDIARDLLDSDYGVDISYYLGKNIGKLREMALMSPTQRMKAMGRLEERFSARASAGKKRSKAPDTPGRKAKKGKSVAESKYGPDDQDEFDRAFNSL